MICTKCKQDLDLSFFGKNKQHKDWYRHQCKACRKSMAAVYYKKNSKRILNRNHLWCRNNKDKYDMWYRWYQLSQRYKLSRKVRYGQKKTSSDWTINFITLTALKIKQENKCAICSRELVRDIKWQTELDHIKPISRWWHHTIGNVQRTCRTCNRRKNCY